MNYCILIINVLSLPTNKKTNHMEDRLRGSSSEKKKSLIKEFELSEISIGEEIYVFNKAISSSYTGDGTVLCTVLNIEGNNVEIKPRDYKKSLIINKEDIASRLNKRSIGSNPFNDNGGAVRPVNYTIEGIIFSMQLFEGKKEEPYVINNIVCGELNWNPFVYDSNRNKRYYQRAFCWDIEQERSLIDSIYNNISVGSILVRRRDWEELAKISSNGETELFFRDIVDGKQRLNTIRRFVNNKFSDSHGNFYSDLSDNAQYRFLNSQLLGYSEMSSFSKDKDVLYQFLKTNFTGVPQSKEHIEYVQNLIKLL